MKKLGVVLIVCGVAAVVPAGFAGFKETKRTRAHQTRIDELTSERTRVRDQLREVGLAKRGFEQSIPEMPDSTRMQQSGLLVAKGREYGKALAILEGQDREITRLILRQRAMKGERNERLVWYVGGLGGAGVVLLGVGAALARRGGG